jgi:outer membrane biosynthesis protein TonB
MAAERGRQRLAAVLAVVVMVAHSGLPAGAGSVARFGGRVLGADGATPRPGVTVVLVEEGRQVLRSEPSDDRGAFRFDSAAPGTYTLIAQGPEGAFVATGKVSLREGENPAVALALRPAPQEPEEQQGPDKEEPSPDTEGADKAEEPAPDTPKEEGEPPKEAPPTPPKKEGLSPLTKGLIGGAVGLLAVAVILEIDDTEDPGSPF